MSKSWLIDARGTPEGLLVPGRPVGRAASIRLGSDGLLVGTETAQVALEWEGNPKEWFIGPWSPGQQGTSVGVGLHTARPPSRELQAVRRATDSLGNRISSWRLFRKTAGQQPVVPLYVASWQRDRITEEQHMLQWLCRLLAARPHLRHRLTDQSRMDDLVAEMSRGSLHPARVKIDRRRGTAEIGAAMAAAVLIHPLGNRPIPGDALVPRDEAVQMVFARLAANPRAAGIKIDRDQVIEALRRYYFSIPPWPFASLVR
jgi:hypothetical protein